MPDPTPETETEETRAAARYPSIIAYVRETPWAITPKMLQVIRGLLHERANGIRLTPAEVRERIGTPKAARPATARTRGGIAVLGLRGLIAHRAEAFEQVSAPGGTSVERFRARFRAALADPEVGSIVIDVDSPGGSTDGIPELAAEIRAARGDKPIVAVANTMAASAAYWLGAQADELVVSPSAVVGSIGVFAIHEDESEMNARIGIKPTLISAGDGKTEGNPFGPLSDEALEAIQARVDVFFKMFVDAVAKGRGVKAAVVRGGFGTGKPGRIFTAAEAVDLGMADRVATLDETVARLGGGARPARQRNQARHRHSFSF